DRPYSCDHPGCDKAFVRNHDLIRHKKSHQEKA
nr:Chain A, SWI5 [Saccharomyces cerevisiae]